MTYAANVLGQPITIVLQNHSRDFVIQIYRNAHNRTAGSDVSVVRLSGDHYERIEFVSSPATAESSEVITNEPAHQGVAANESIRQKYYSK